MELINQDALSDLIKTMADKHLQAQLSVFRAHWEAEREDRLVSREDAAKMLDIHVNTLDKLRDRNLIKAKDIGKLVKYRVTELLRYMSCN